jgi:hypothetical protein
VIEKSRGEVKVEGRRSEERLSIPWMNTKSPSGNFCSQARSVLSWSSGRSSVTKNIFSGKYENEYNLNQSIKA